MFLPLMAPTLQPIAVYSIPSQDAFGEVEHPFAIGKEEFLMAA